MRCEWWVEVELQVPGASGACFRKLETCTIAHLPSGLDTLLPDGRCGTMIDCPSGRCAR